MSKQGKRRCIFCGGGKVSKEHVLPAWIEDAITPTFSFPTDDLHLSQPVPGQDHNRAIPAFDWTVKRVCGPCNYGWMERQVERPVQDLMTRMIRGEAVTLDELDQKRLATWATKTAMIVQYTRTPVRHLRPDEARWMYETISPLPRSRIWITGLIGPSIMGNFASLQLSAVDPRERDKMESPPPLISGEQMTLAVGYLAFQVLKWAKVDVPVRNLINTDDISFAFPIWPIHQDSIPWPPPNLVSSNEAFDRYSHAFDS